jgi:methyl-accepting chemotaxis protein
LDVLDRLLRHRTAHAPQPSETPIVTGAVAEATDDAPARALEELLRHQAQLADTAQAIAGGNLARDVVMSSDEDTLGAAFREMLAGLRRLVGQVKDTAADVDTGAQSAGDAGARTATGAINSADAAVVELRRAIASIARGADEQMAQVQAAAGAIARVSTEVDRVADTAQDLAQASERARLAAERGADAVRNTVSGIRAIADSTTVAAGRVRDLDALSQRIGAVVATIDAIAEQTNLLALNAAIEAARAGSHGRGFAVVAGEVRKLAERSRRETQQIGELVRNIQRETGETAPHPRRRRGRAARARAGRRGRRRSGGDHSGRRGGRTPGRCHRHIGALGD